MSPEISRDRVANGWREVPVFCNQLLGSSTDRDDRVHTWRDVDVDLSERGVRYPGG